MIDRLIKISNRLWVGNFFVSLRRVKMKSSVLCLKYL